ncbi:hypothetical protein ACFPRL_06875 [Pseudoclavibacter helvolus]
MQSDPVAELCLETSGRVVLVPGEPGVRMQLLAQTDGGRQLGSQRRAPSRRQLVEPLTVCRRSRRSPSLHPVPRPKTLVSDLISCVRPESAYREAYDSAPPPPLVTVRPRTKYRARARRTPPSLSRGRC